MKLTFKHPDDQAVEAAIARFRQSPACVAFAGIKIKARPPTWEMGKGFDGGWTQEQNAKVDAEIVAAICRAWLAATDE